MPGHGVVDGVAGTGISPGNPAGRIGLRPEDIITAVDRKPGLAMALSPTLPLGVLLSLYRARPLDSAEIPELYAVVDALSRRAELPATPRLYYVPSAMLNAFAVGNRRAAAIAVTDGMLRRLSFREIAGVLAHEVSHVASNDLWIMNMADVMSRVTAVMSYIGFFLLALNLPLIATGALIVPWGLVLVLLMAPFFISLLQLALSCAGVRRGFRGRRPAR